MSDYTPGHAMRDIADLIIAGTPANTVADILTQLYKAGQVNERAAVIAGLRARYSRSLRPDDEPGPEVSDLLGVADMIEWREI